MYVLFLYSIVLSLKSFLAILRGKKIFLQIDSKWSEMRKKHKIGDAEFLPVAGAGNRRSTYFPSREC